jgi:hypothetical protein
MSPNMKSHSIIGFCIVLLVLLAITKTPAKRLPGFSAVAQWAQQIAIRVPIAEVIEILR